jgi:hypothetical protein
MIGEINGQGSKRSGKSRGQENQTVTNAFHIPLDAARARIPPGPDDPQFVILRERGSLTV